MATVALSGMGPPPPPPPPSTTTPTTPPAAATSGLCCPNCGASIKGELTADSAKLDTTSTSKQTLESAATAAVAAVGPVPPLPVHYKGYRRDSRDSVSSVRFENIADESGEDDSSDVENVRSRWRHLSETPPPTQQAGSSQHNCSTARHHWIASTTRGSLEIRSPAKDALLNSKRLNKSLPHNRSDSKLSVAGKGSETIVKPKERRVSGGGGGGGGRNSGGSRVDQLKAGGGAVQGGEDQQGGGGGGSLPRTLSTSVLRIKHRRSFWERVVG